MTVQYANQEQIDLMKELLLRHELFYGHYDRLWKLIRLHEEDVRTPGDATRMTADLANETIGWLNRQVARMDASSDRVNEPPARVMCQNTPPRPSEKNEGQRAKLENSEENQGVYLKDGEVYVVKLNKAETHLYAKRLVEAPGHQRRTTEAGTRTSFDLEYAPGVVKTLTEADRMKLADAREVMTRYGRCLYCRHPLKAAESVERMVGPVCAKRFAI